MLLEEIVPLVATGDISLEEATAFALQVIDRFSNESIEHLWLNISVQYTSKMQMRVVPLVEKYIQINGKAPLYMSFGYAAFVSFMKSEAHADGKFYGKHNGATYEIKDEKAAEMSVAWSSNKTFIDSAIFNNLVFDFIEKINNSTVPAVLASVVNK
jgi:tagaturonate reductase